MHLDAVHAVATEPRPGAAAQCFQIHIGPPAAPVPAGKHAGKTSFGEALTPSGGSTPRNAPKIAPRSSGR